MKNFTIFLLLLVIGLTPRFTSQASPLKEKATHHEFSAKISFEQPVISVEGGNDVAFAPADLWHYTVQVPSPVWRTISTDLHPYTDEKVYYCLNNNKSPPDKIVPGRHLTHGI